MLRPDPQGRHMNVTPGKQLVPVVAFELVIPVRFGHWCKLTLNLFAKFVYEEESGASPLSRPAAWQLPPVLSTSPPVVR